MMISYAQNFEDVILERIFKNIDSGFYVDVGACHPIYDSVTYHFYLKGWNGINVEPQPKLYSKLKEIRKRDTNLQACVGAAIGSQTLYITHDVGTSTLNQTIAENYRKQQNIAQEITVELITLNQIWSEHIGHRRVDFMKIDVEGFEKEVLSGADFSVVAPSILVIEATLPNSQHPCHEQWEYLILEYYEFIYFDGLNRFYSRKGAPAGDGTLLAPPNLFDRFKTYSQVMLEQANESLDSENQEMKKQVQAGLEQLANKDEALNDASNAYADLQTENRNLHQQLELASTSILHSQAEFADSQHAYELLQKAYAKKEEDLLKALDTLGTKDAALQDATAAYQSLQKELNLQIDALKARITQKETQDELGKVMSYCESLINQIQQKDHALADAAEAYLILKEEFDRKVRELRELHESITKPEQPHNQ
ncbi:FkbM family methyltransferase [Pseudomonas fluvialis]|uniref:FkbM family methyltransferase n=1 Tax=Pseudomonas fluvialis TaxID=1793966 RepID=A0A7X0ET09_9PSED|nr:FkbM family methyltransferase [Pseudomonas fluvialis]MBB6342873.1 FkbM family methyltransferase [Pseudomonas fluvialis]